MTNSQRDTARARRRRRLRRQRQAAGIAVVLALTGLLVLAATLLNGGDSLPPPQSSKTSKTSSVKKAEPEVPAAPVPWAAALAGAINGATHLGESATLDRFARRSKRVYCGGSRGRYVALTFDDGPGAYTRLTLAILRRNHVRATFFLIGSNIASRSSLAREELGDFAALGVHAWVHKPLDGRRPAKIRNQIVWTRSAIKKASGATAQIFRPPYGARNARVDRVAHRLGMVEVLWSIDSGDSQGKNWRQVGREVLRNIQPGSIVLMHDNRGQTIRALNRLILPGIKKRGLVPVTVPELLLLDPPPPNDSSMRCWAHPARY
ncbi:MAG: polysaccharide deacetylase family protein [Gaiellaceae bacterium]